MYGGSGVVKVDADGPEIGNVSDKGIAKRMRSRTNPIGWSLAYPRDLTVRIPTVDRLASVAMSELGLPSRGSAALWGGFSADQTTV